MTESIDTTKDIDNGLTPEEEAERKAKLPWWKTEAFLARNPKNIIEWLDQEPMLPKAKRKQWREGNRSVQNDGGKWLVRGPLNDQQNDIHIQSQTLVRDIGVGIPNTNDPDPEQHGKFLSNLAEHGYFANRHARRASR
jgi:hypothetical protein